MTNFVPFIPAGDVDYRYCNAIQAFKTAMTMTHYAPRAEKELFHLLSLKWKGDSKTSVLFRELQVRHKNIDIVDNYSSAYDIFKNKLAKAAFENYLVLVLRHIGSRTY